MHTLAHTGTHAHARAHGTPTRTHRPELMGREGYMRSASLMTALK